MEFNLIPNLVAYINDKYTAAGGDDGLLITAPELLKGVKGLSEFVQQRGMKVIADTGLFASTSGEDAWLVLVKNLGIFEFTYDGVADGVRSFAAQSAGIYTLVSRFPPETVTFSINLNTPYAFVFPAGYSLNKMLINAAFANTVQIGTTPGGNEVEADIFVQPITNPPYFKPMWYLTDTTLYFSGATSQVNFKLLFD